MFSGSSFYPGTWGLGLIGPESPADEDDLVQSILQVGRGMADPALTAPLRRLCQERGIPVCEEFAMARLGEAAGIQVGAAVVTVVEKHR